MSIKDSYPTATKPARFDPARTQRDKLILCPALESEDGNRAGYARSGGCTAGCGACCEAFVVPLNMAGRENKEFARVNDVGQIVLPVDEVVKNKEGMADWEHLLSLHEAYLFQLPSSLLTAEIPIEASGPLPLRGQKEWVAWLEQYGITVLRRPGQQLAAHVPVSCTKLKDGLCSIVGTPEHPKMCARYPRHPRDIEGLDFCTYEFIPLTKTTDVPVTVKPKRNKGKRKKNANRRKR